MKIIKAKTSLATLHNARNLKVYIKRNDTKAESTKPLTYKAYIDQFTSRGSKWLLKKCLKKLLQQYCFLFSLPN